MRIIYFEMKKLLNLKLIFLLIIINIVLYYAYINPFIDDFNRGRPKADQYKLFVEMKKLYGNTMDVEEFKHFKEYYNERAKEADAYIKTNEEFVKRGILTYKQYRDMDDISKRHEMHEIAMFTVKSVDFFWELPEREQVIMLFEYYHQKYASSKKDPKDYQTSIFYNFIFYHYNELIKAVCIIILINIVFIVSSLFQRDNVIKLKYLQYTSKVGRKLFLKKLTVGLISSFLIATVLLIAFLMQYFKGDETMFLNNNINSAFNYSKSWYNIPFIHYILLTIIAMYTIVFLFTIIAMLISNQVNNYIILMVIQLLAVLLLSKVIGKSLDLLIDIRLPQMLMPSCFLFLTIAIVTVLITKYNKEKAIDIIY